MKSKLIIIIALLLLLTGCNKSIQSQVVEENKTTATVVEDALTEGVPETVPENVSEPHNQEAPTDDANNAE